MLQELLSALGLTMEDAIVTAGSAAVVMLLVCLIWLAGFRATLKLDMAALEQIAQREGVGLEAALIDPHGRAALGRLSNGALMIVRVMADGVGARVAPAAAVAIRLTRGRARVALGDLGFPALDLRLEGEPPNWLKQLAGEGT